jgi:raffinose/stachyose/melibiose transport system permease protein
MEPKAHRGKKLRPWMIVTYLVLTLYLLYTLYPIFLMVATSLKSNKEILANPSGFPRKLYLDGFTRLFQRENFLVYFRNSFFVTIVSLLIILAVTLLLSYALARYRGRTSSFLYLFFLAGMMLPLRLGLLSLNDLLYKLGLIDNLWGLIFIYVAMNIPFSMLILTGFIKMIPPSLEESAFLDGADTLTILRKVVIPLIRPAIATVIVYDFVPIWNDVFFPLIFIKSQGKRTLMQAVTLFFGQFSSNWNLVFAALTLACIPVIILYLCCSKYLIRGLMAGAVKE